MGVLLLLVLLIIRWVGSQVFFVWVAMSHFDWPVTSQKKKESEALEATQNRTF